MRGRRGGALAVAATLGLAAPAFAGTTIDTTGFAGNTSYPFTVYSPGDMSSDGSEVAQTFVAPAGAQTLTKVAAVLTASGQAQNAELSLWSADDTGPIAQLQTTNIVIPSGPGLREFPVTWPVTAGGRYAFLVGVSDGQVTANTALALPNVGGVDARNVYAGGWVFTRNVPPPTWTSRTDIDIKFRLDFDGGATGGGGGGGGGGTTPTTPTTTTTPAATPAPPAGGTTVPALPAGRRALKAAKGKPGLPASVTCTGGICTVALTAPKGTRSARVRVLRAGTVAGTASAKFRSSRKATKRTLKVTPKVSVAGSYTVELTVVTASGAKVVLRAVLQA